MNTDMPMDEPVDDVVIKACRDCGRLFHPALTDDTYCRSCTEVDDGLTDQNGLRLRSEHIPK